MQRLKVYISGPMKDIINNNKEEFDKAALYIKTIGHVPVNPLHLTEHLINPSREECLKIDIEELLTCQGIYMLNNWENYNGAKLEYNVAMAIGLKRIW